MRILKENIIRQVEIPDGKKHTDKPYIKRGTV